MKVSLLAIIWILGRSGFVYSQNDVGKFSSYGINEGLSQSTVISIFQDNKGFIWFGTTDGLNCFDGNKFTIYKNKRSNTNSLSDSWIVRIQMEDSENNLWIMTCDRAINKFNLRTNEIVRFIPSTNNSSTLTPFHDIYSIVEDTHKNIWISTNSGVFKIAYPQYKVMNYSQKIFDRNYQKDIPISILKDSKGIIWFASTLGLKAFDEKSGKIISYTLDKNGLKGLSSDKILGIVHNKQQQLWILTDKGLCKYKQKEDNFIFYPLTINSNYDNTSKSYILKADNYGNIWIGSSNGLVQFDIQNAKYRLFTKNIKDKHAISDNGITQIFESAKGELWIGTNNGLNRYNRKLSEFDIYYQELKNTTDNKIADICELRSGEIWVTSSMNQRDGGSLSRVNTRGKYLETFSHDPCDRNSIASSYISLPTVDNTGNLWLGSFGDGTIKYSPRVSNFYHFRNVLGNIAGYSSIWGFGEDPFGNIWIAAYNQGFSKFDTATHLFYNYKPKVIINHKPVNYSVMSVCPDKKGKIWVSTVGAGLIYFDPVNGKSKNFLSDKSITNGISSNYIRSMTSDKTGKLYLAHFESGVDIFDPKTEKIKTLKNNPSDKNSLPNNSVWYILSDKAENLWISTNGFVSYYNTKTHKFINYPTGITGKQDIPAFKALSIYESSTGDVWFGTSGGGLSKFNPVKKDFTSLTEEDGLSNGVVYGITEDTEGYLWLSTNRGLSKFNPKNKTFKNYEENAGLQSNEFNAGAFFKSNSKKMYFGGINGFNAFDPLTIKDDTLTPSTVFTGFQINNKAIPIIEPYNRKPADTKSDKQLFLGNAGYFLPYNIAYMSSLSIPYKVKVFTIEFAALLFNSPEKCTFRYKMEHFDEDWNYSGTRNYATYTNLPPGTYTFKVQSANPDGVWSNKSTTIQIIIVPPFWKTWWFITIIVLLSITVIWLIILVRENNLRKSKALLENRVKNRTQQIEEKNEELRLRNMEISKQKEELDFQAKQLKSELVNHNQSSEIALLRSQINPHFLFNTLNNIYSLVYQKSDDAPTAVMKLSEIMRYMLYDATTDKVPLEKEINYLKSFIELQVLRLKNKDCVEFSVTGNIYGKMIAPMLFIPFVENAFKHGNKRSENPCIIINLAINGHHIVFDILNPYLHGESVNKDETGGIGLTNVRRRLELLYPNTHSLQMDDSDGKFHVILDLNLNEN